MASREVYKWSAIDRICNSVMTFGGNIMLAILLDPFDFGLLGMVAIFSAIALNLSDCGMSDGLVHKLHPTEEDYSTLFVFNGGMGLFFGLLYVGMSGYIADFFGHPQLRGIMIVLGVCFFFRTLSLVQETKLRKELDFRKLTQVRLLSTATALVLAIVLVQCGLGYWGLVAMQIFVNFLLFFYFLVLTKWRPRLAFSKQSFKAMYGFGFNLMVAFLCTQIARNINALVISKNMTAASVGVYSQAQKMEEVPYGIVDSTLMAPFFSILSSSEDEKERIRKSSEMHQIAIFIFSLISAYLFMVAAPAFNTIFGSKWDAAIPIFQILLFFGLATALKGFYTTVLKAKGKTNAVLKLTIIEVVLQLGLLCFTYDKGIKAIAFSQLIPAFVVLACYAYLYISSVGESIVSYIKKLLASLWMPVLVFALTAVGAVLLPDMIAFLKFCAVSLTFLLSVFAVGEISRNPSYCFLKQMVMPKKK